MTVADVDTAEPRLARAQSEAQRALDAAKTS